MVLCATVLVAVPLAGVGASVPAGTSGAAVTNFPLASFPSDITAGPEGALWFTDFGTSAKPERSIGRITPAGVVTTFASPAIGSPGGITAGPDGALWFTNQNGNKFSIGRMTTSGTVTTYTDRSLAGPGSITAGPDGALWFTNDGTFDNGRPTADTGSIGRITTSGTVTEYPLPNGIKAIYIVVGQDGALWFTDGNSGTLGRITTAGLIDDFLTPTSTSQPFGIASGPDGAIWFTEETAGQIGRAALPLFRKSVVPASGATATQTFVMRFYDPDGTSDLNVLDVLINNFLNGQGACYLAYQLSSNTLFLVDDRGDAGGPFAGGMVLNGSSGQIQNSQCQVNGSGSSATVSGNVLLLTLNITFQPSFSGNKIVHLAQVNQAQYTAGWGRQGVWQVPGAAAAQITFQGASPARGVSTGGITQPITLNVTDTLSTTNLGIVNLLINDFIDGRNACYVAYSVGSNTLYLVDDSGDAGGPFAGSMILNGSGLIENAQCQVIGAGTSATQNGNLLTLTLNLLFKEGFVGNHVFYGAARDTASANNTDWQASGTWSVQ